MTLVIFNVLYDFSHYIYLCSSGSIYLSTYNITVTLTVVYSPDCNCPSASADYTYVYGTRRVRVALPYTVYVKLRACVSAKIQRSESTTLDGM